MVINRRAPHRRLALLRLAGIAPLALSWAAFGAALKPADLILTNARISTQDARRSEVEALAVRDGKVVATGTAASVARLRGPKTQVVDAGGGRVLPGLVDAHIHTSGGVFPIDICDLNSKPMALNELADFVRGCIERYKIEPGGWLTVSQWNFVQGNAPTADLPTIRAALDRGSPTVAIQLVGNDFHHGAYNSAALKQAKDSKGNVIGLSARTLAGPFADISTFIGVDAKGEPNGDVNEEARDVMASPQLSSVTFDAVLREPEKTPQTLNAAGITAMQEAVVRIGATNRLFDDLQKRGTLTLHVDLLPLETPEEYTKPDGTVDMAAMLAKLSAFRARYANNPLIKANGVKIFVDASLEGNPRSNPPSLPGAAVFGDFLQPIFKLDATGFPIVTGYIDTGSTLCQQVRADTALLSDSARVAAFQSEHGFHPVRCRLSNGSVVTGPPWLNEYAAMLHKAGFMLHLHANADRAVATALDALEYAQRQAPGVDVPNSIAHLQLVRPSDFARLQKIKVYGIFTHSWASQDPNYDVSVVPFIENVLVDGKMDLHRPDGRYQTTGYPTRSFMNAGGIVAAGSDAPVFTRNPQPFVNIAMAVTRALPGGAPMGPQERLTVQEAIDSYTVNAAASVGRSKEIGSLEVGKAADFILLDRDILALGAPDKADAIRDTKVLKTWFAGRLVHSTTK